MKGIVVAIDGPAGAGKSTVSRHLALALGYRYIDTSGTHDGISRMLLKRGAPTKSKIIVKGVGAALGEPAFPLASIDEVRVQLTNQSTGVCWESEFPVSSLGDRINLKGP